MSASLAGMVRVVGAAILSLCAMVGTGAGAQAEKGPAETVRFAPGATSAVRKGVVRGYGSRDYIVAATSGQTMSVRLASKSRFASFSILDEGSMEPVAGDPKPLEVTAWSGAIPASGTYTVRVALVRAEARRKGVASFALTISIAPATSSAGAPSSGVDTSGQWILQSMMHGSSEVTIPSGIAIRATFADGRVTGRAVCNNYFASCAIDGGRVTLGDVGSTRMMCGLGADVESQYFEVLHASTTIDVRDGRLTLSGAAGALTFTKQ